MTLFWFCVGVWVVLMGTVVFAIADGMAHDRAFARHADQAIDLAGGER